MPSTQRARGAQESGRGSGSVARWWQSVSPAWRRGQVVYTGVIAVVATLAYTDNEFFWPVLLVLGFPLSFAFTLVLYLVWLPIALTAGATSDDLDNEAVATAALVVIFTILSWGQFAVFRHVGQSVAARWRER